MSHGLSEVLNFVVRWAIIYLESSLTNPHVVDVCSLHFEQVASFQSLMTLLESF